MSIVLFMFLKIVVFSVVYEKISLESDKPLSEKNFLKFSLKNTDYFWFVYLWNGI